MKGVLIMNYSFDKEFIHDRDAMWDFALSVMCDYNFLVEQVERSKTESSILYNGEIVMKFDPEYKKILTDYKNKLQYMNKFLGVILKRKDSKVAKYVKACT